MPNNRARIYIFIWGDGDIAPRVLPAARYSPNNNNNMGRMGVRFLEAGRKWRLPGLLYADDLVLWGESGGSEGDDRAFCVLENRFEISADKSKVMVSGEEEGLGCKARVDGTRLEQVSRVQIFGCFLNELLTDDNES